MNEPEHYSNADEPARDRQSRNFDAYLLEKISGLQGMVVLLVLAGLVALGAGLWWVRRSAAESTDERLVGTNRRLVDLEVERGGLLQRLTEQEKQLIVVSNALVWQHDISMSNVLNSFSVQDRTVGNLSNGLAALQSALTASNEIFARRLAEVERLSSMGNVWTQRVDSAARAADSAARRLEELQKRFSALEAEWKQLRRPPAGRNDSQPTNAPANAPP